MAGALAAVDMEELASHLDRQRSRSGGDQPGADALRRAGDDGYAVLHAAMVAMSPVPSRPGAPWLLPGAARSRLYSCGPDMSSRGRGVQEQEPALLGRR